MQHSGTKIIEAQNWIRGIDGARYIVITSPLTTKHGAGRFVKLALEWLVLDAPVIYLGQWVNFLVQGLGGVLFVVIKGSINGEQSFVVVSVIRLSR